MTALAHKICECGHDGLSHVIKDSTSLSATLKDSVCMWTNCDCSNFTERSSRNDEGFDVT